MGKKKDEVVVEEVLEEVESEEASPAREGHSSGWHYRQKAHVPGPRRKRKLDPAASDWKAPAGAEEETVAEAPAEAEVSDDGDNVVE